MQMKWWNRDNVHLPYTLSGSLFICNGLLPDQKPFTWTYSDDRGHQGQMLRCIPSNLFVGLGFEANADDVPDDIRNRLYSFYSYPAGVLLDPN